jgi:predicted RecB family nuclease
MQKNKNQNNHILYSASDLANFLECEHLTYLDRLHLDHPMQKTASGEDAVLIQNKGLAHEKAYLKHLQEQHNTVVDIIERVGEKASTATKVEATLKAMQEGADIIYQATFMEGNLLGHADFLRRVPRPSNLGDYSYEVIDTKLSGKERAKFIIQLIFYSKLLANIQGVYPRAMYVMLGNNTEKMYYCADYSAYFEHLLVRFLQHTEQEIQISTYPDPCKKCQQCHWSERCDEQRTNDDHLSQVAGISKSQIVKLKDAGIQTMAALAALHFDTVISKINALSLDKIRHQAFLQDNFRRTGEARVDLLPIDNERKRGFLRLPEANIGDLYFDMEGNPLEDGGNLEYLFGLYYMQGDAPVFKGFWALTRLEEKKAFEDFMDFVMNHLQQHPDAHIYHYASYEETALKRLMSEYGTRESAVDHLLRKGKLVDLYKVVLESMRTSEPRYSIKNIEHFYLEKRQGEVTSAGASIIYFEKWKATGEQKYLDDIEAYNIDDVRSTMELHRWLLTKRPGNLAWANPEANKQEKAENDTQSVTPASALREQELERYRIKLLGNAIIPEDEKTAEDKTNELVFQLMDFHRREAKPSWWDFFQRQEKDDAELLEDPGTIAGLTLDPSIPPECVKRSIRYSFTYPAQETKLHGNSSPVIVETGNGIANFKVDPDINTLSFTMGAKAELPDKITLGPGMPIDSKVMVTAIQRYVDARIAKNNQYQAIDALLARQHPNIHGHSIEQPILPQNAPLEDEAITAISNLDNSYLIVQGPPGTGKTYTGSKVIVALLKQGKRVGITSNSHKAINNLLLGVQKEARRVGFSFNGVKKSGGNDEELADCENINLADDNKTAFTGEFNLVAGTAWLFARDEADQFLDYLFIDEAGQVAVANLVAVGTSTKNIILLGDQMQLGQPTQGTHPGESGKSALEFLLQDEHTVAANRGIFLGVSYRMHPTICEFISDTVYDGRLKSDISTEMQSIVLNDSAHPVLKKNGLVYLPIHHQNCTQSSDEEAQFVLELMQSLLAQSYTDNNCVQHPITYNDILVVTPYNLQVQKLKSTLPEGTRIGTVDKFQGQEAPVVIFSMVTSSGDDLPRDIEFLYSKNRLNVAISRAQALMLFIANPKLMSIQCNKPEEMAMVNTLCQLQVYEAKDRNNEEK